MKKSRIFMTLGTLALAISAVFATKANKKFFATVQTAYFYTTVAGYHVAFAGNTVGSIVTSAPHGKATLSGATVKTLYYNDGQGTDNADYSPAYNADF